MYIPLTTESVIDYVKSSPVYADHFLPDDELRVVDLAEGGNVNLIFRVHAAADPNRTVLVKQALPHSRRYPDFKMPLERARIEYDVLSIEAQYCPDNVPTAYLFDREMYANIMEDLHEHLIMRQGMIRQLRYPRFAEDMGLFLARTLFHTSDLYLPSAEKKELVPRFINPVLCKVTEDLFFTQPVVPHDNNRWTSPELDQQVAGIYGRRQIFAEMLLMKEKFMTQTQALVHGDFHTGSIMLNQIETKVIDPEFAFYGPVAFDVGSLLGNLIIGYASQEGHAPDAASRDAYRDWLLEALVDVWRVFESEFRLLWKEKADPFEWGSGRFRDRYLRQILQDAAGFGGAELFRRTIGLAHVDDFVEIEDTAARARAESLALDIGEHWLLGRGSVNDIEELAAQVRRLTN
jgi:5-methylthioribose kinase